MSGTAEFWFGGDHFVTDIDNVWEEMDERWPEGVEKPNPEVAERIIREIADPVEGGESG
jgi:hypothetical protein